MDGTPFGRYRLVELLGRGGMGEVWRAHDSAADRIVAPKLLPSQWAQDETFKERFRREAHAAAQLTEPHVVPSMATERSTDDWMWICGSLRAATCRPCWPTDPWNRGDGANHRTGS